jgi:hypothetical protein
MERSVGEYRANINQQIAAIETQISAIESKLATRQYKYTTEIQLHYKISGLRSDIALLVKRRDLPDTSIRLRLWRGERGLRDAAPLLTTTIAQEIGISLFSRIENGNLENVDAGLLHALESYLDREMV